jgi:hypothetical protein
MDAKQRRESGDEAEADKAESMSARGCGLVVIGAAALVVSAFLPLAQPFGGIPIVGNNNLFKELGWHLWWIPFFLVLFGFQAFQGKRFARWSLIGVCALAAVGIAWLANDKDLRTLYPIGAGGAPDTTQPGLTTSLGIAIYVAGAAVAVAFIGALALLQGAGIAERLASARAVQRRSGAPAKAKPEGDPEPEQAALEVESSAVEVEAHTAEAQPRSIGSVLQSTWPAIAAVVVLAATAAGYLLLGRPSQSSAASPTPPSLTAAQTDLEKLLLSPDQINTAMGNTGVAVGQTFNEMLDVAANVSDKACEPIANPAEANVYAGSGWTDVVGQVLVEPGSTYRHAVFQVVVSFHSAQDASAFFTTSAQQWPACANRQYTNVKMGQEMVHNVGPVSNTDGTLSVTQTQPHGEATFTCQRALTAAGKVVVDVAACSLNLPDASHDAQSDAAVNIAHQIAGNAVPGA